MYKIWSQKLSCDWWWEQWAYFITTQTLLFFQIGVRFARQQDPLPYLVSQPLPWQVHSVSHSRRSSKVDEVSFNKICISVELRSLTPKRWHSRVTDVLVWIQLTLILHMTRPPTQPHPGHLVQYAPPILWGLVIGLNSYWKQWWERKGWKVQFLNSRPPLPALLEELTHTFAFLICIATEHEVTWVKVWACVVTQAQRMKLWVFMPLHSAEKQHKLKLRFPSDFVIFVDLSKSLNHCSGVSTVSR